MTWKTGNLDIWNNKVIFVLKQSSGVYEDRKKIPRNSQGWKYDFQSPLLGVHTVPSMRHKSPALILSKNDARGPWKRDWKKTYFQLWELWGIFFLCLSNQKLYFKTNMALLFQMSRLTAIFTGLSGTRKLIVILAVNTVCRYKNVWVSL